MEKFEPVAYSKPFRRNIATVPLRYQKPDKDYARGVQEQLKFLMEKHFTAEDLRFKKEFNDRYRGKKSRVPIRTHNKHNYVRGVLDIIYGIRMSLQNEHEAVSHVEFMYVLGMTPEQICYCMFTMGYINMTLEQIKKHLNSGNIEKKLEEIHRKYMTEVKLLKQQVFQEMAAETMEEEKKFLQTLLQKLPSLRLELEDTCPIQEPTKWNRLNKTIQSILDQCKGMHGIDEARSATIKVKAAQALQENKPNDGYFPLPQPMKHPEMEDSRIITLEQESQVIRDVNEL